MVITVNEWGWNPASFEAIGTVVAAIIAVSAIYVGRRQALEQARRETATLRSALARSARTVQVTLRHIEETTDLVRYQLKIENGSGRPIHNLRAEIHQGHTWWVTTTSWSSEGKQVTRRLEVDTLIQRPHIARRTTGISANSFSEFLKGRHLTVFGPEGDWLPAVLEPDNVVEREIVRTRVNLFRPVVKVSFTDPDRYRWVMGTDGSLKLDDENGEGGIPLDAIWLPDT